MLNCFANRQIELLAFFSLLPLLIRKKIDKLKERTSHTEQRNEITNKGQVKEQRGNRKKEENALFF